MHETEDSDFKKTRNITITLNENLANQLQQLVNAAGTDISTFFTSAAEQAVRARELTLKRPTVNLFECKLALENTHYTKDGHATISKDDEWAAETEWDDLYETMKLENSDNLHCLNHI